MYNNTSKIQTGFKNDPESYWISSTERETYPQLKGKAAADVVVVGAGIFGVTTALFLTEAGFNTVLIEGRRILNGTTGYTTAKVTSQHRMIYDYLITKFGREKALQYANANQAAIEKIAELVEQYNIDCDFLRMGAYVYTESEAFIENIQKEVEAAKSLGIPASYTKDTGLPFTVKCAVRFDRQAQFHPLKYLTALVENAVKKGLDIYENTRAVDIREQGNHIPNKNEQMVRYMGYCRNVCRGRRKKEDADESDFAVQDDEYTKGANKSWAHLIKKIYEVDPLICPKCGGNMRIIAFIEDYKIVRKILDWLGIYEFKRDRPPPKILAHADSFDDYGQNDYIDCDYSDF